MGKATTRTAAANLERERWCEHASKGLEAYAVATGLDFNGSLPDSDAHEALVDLLVDLAHWCDATSKANMAEALASARRHYQAETGGRGKQL